MRCFLAFFFIYSSSLFAQDYFLLENPKCTIQLFSKNKLTHVDPSSFYSIPLQAEKLKMNPDFMAFTIKKSIYITPKNCLHIRVKTAINPEPVVIDKYFVEVAGGINSVGDQNQVPTDYNLLFPGTDPTTPISWGESASSPYTTNSLFNLGFGLKATAESYYVFKIRMFKGEKKDSVVLTDINSSTTQNGIWTYSDLIVNAYIGYQLNFLPSKKWKISFTGFTGISNYSSSVTDGTNTYKLSSTLLPVFMAEAGFEYRIEKQIGVGLNLSYEYLGIRSLNTSTATNVKTKMSYTNTAETLSVRYYF